MDSFESAWKALPKEEQATAAIFASDYGVAGAIDHYGPARGMPKAISGHNNYWLWCAHGSAATTVIVQSEDDRRLCELFESVELHGRIACGSCMPSEISFRIWICRKPKATLSQIWPSAKNFS